MSLFTSLFGSTDPNVIHMSGGASNDTYSIDADYADSHGSTFIISEGRYAFKTAHNKYLRANDVVDQASALNSWETFVPISQDSGGKSIALKTAHGDFVRAKRDGSVDRAGAINSFERFGVVNAGGKVALKTHHNTFVSARDNGSVNQMPNLYSWETFQPIEVDGGRDTISFINTNRLPISLNLNILHSQKVSNADVYVQLGTVLGHSIENVDGGMLSDVIVGNSANNRLNGQLGHDHLDGGDGNDTLFGAHGNDNLAGGDGDDNLAGGDGDDNLAGGDGDDNLAGGDGGDNLAGGDGGDSLDGGHGYDLLTGNSGNDQLYGGPGDDRLYGGLGDDTLLGGDWNDFLVGESGNDFLVGDNGDDTLNGADGDDKISTGHGRDVVYGGAGNDNFIINGVGYLNTVIEDYGAGDTVTFTEGVVASYSLKQQGSAAILTLNGTPSVTLKNTSIADVTINAIGNIAFQ